MYVYGWVMDVWVGMYVGGYVDGSRVCVAVWVGGWMVDVWGGVGGCDSMCGLRVYVGGWLTWVGGCLDG